ncbi:MAG TPA: tRNA (adenosine(37)-N6)-threonylcarbamoyltransferase complex dimerization subunit type 1 TsaB [Anaerolineales bacterium]|nr:tRNA (adenosine(37)-N6)-threonylcarbamoyltransferase complex dimerization subunit type 1 TsaB [Anaerolineales bacterium]
MLLAIDTASRMLGVALHDGGRVLSESTWYGSGHHTTELAPEVALALSRAAVEVSELTAVAVALGPGSYTGLRIGLALAKGLSLSHNLQVVGIPTLDILANPQPPREGPMLAVMQAGRGRVAGVWYKWSRKGWSARRGALNLRWEEILAELKQATYICGELDLESRETLHKSEFVELAPPALCVRRPSVLAELALEKVGHGKPEDTARLAPIYLDNSTA